MYKAFSPMHIRHSENMEISAPIAEKYGFEGIFCDIRTEQTLGSGRVRALLEEHHLKPAGFELPTAFWKDDISFEEDLVNLREDARFARECGMDICTTYVLPFSDVMDYRENFRLHAERGRRIAEILGNEGIRFGLEIVGPPSLRKGKKYEFIHTLDEMLELCSAIGTDNIGILMDVFHWDMSGHTLADFDKFADASQIVCVHINDAPAGLTVEEQQDQIRALPGSTGVLKIDDFFKGLKQLGYQGPVLCEPFVDALADLTLDSAGQLLKESFDKVWPV